MIKHTALAVVLLTSLVGCLTTTPGTDVAGNLEDPMDAIEEGGARALEGSSEALGMLAFLNHPSTTYELLDGAVGLDRRAAESIIAHRDGPDGILGRYSDDLFDSVAEVDDCYYVGTAALALIESWAVDQGWVPLADDDVLGTWDDVEFTVAEAAATVEFANTAGATYLDDDLALDARAVDSIVAARPIATVQDLAGLYYVGTSALTILKQEAVGEPGCTVEGWETLYIYEDGGAWRDQVPAEVGAVVDDVLLDDAWCGAASGEPWLVKLTVDRFDCVDKGYTIELGQGMLEYPEISWYIEFEIDASYDWFHSTCEV